MSFRYKHENEDEEIVPYAPVPIGWADALINFCAFGSNLAKSVAALCDDFEADLKCHYNYRADRRDFAVAAGRAIERIADGAHVES